MDDLTAKLCPNDCQCFLAIRRDRFGYQIGYECSNCDGKFKEEDLIDG